MVACECHCHKFLSVIESGLKPRDGYATLVLVISILKNNNNGDQNARDFESVFLL